MTIEQTLEERGKRYGDFTDHAHIAQSLQNDMRSTSGWERLSDVQKQALTVIADKVARILSGDPNYTDNWHDIQGYAKLAEERVGVEGERVTGVRLPLLGEQVEVLFNSARGWQFARVLRVNANDNFTVDVGGSGLRLVSLRHHGTTWRHLGDK